MGTYPWSQEAEVFIGFLVKSAAKVAVTAVVSVVANEVWNANKERIVGTVLSKLPEQTSTGVEDALDRIEKLVDKIPNGFFGIAKEGPVNERAS